MNSVINLIKKTALDYPEKIAIRDTLEEYSYNKFLELSSKIGTALAQKFSCEKRPVIVYLPKCAKAVIAFMGVLYSGGCYVPVDYNIPHKRLMSTCETLNNALIITDEDGRNKISEYENVVLFDNLVKTAVDTDLITQCVYNNIDTDPAYIMYTSGSTGVPKGVVISHRGIIDYVTWIINQFSFDQNSIVGMQSGFHFDNTVFDMYASFFSGGTMVIIPDKLFMFPEMLMDFVKSEKITHILWVPTVMISVAESGVLENSGEFSLKVITFAGEIMPNKTLNVWRKAFPQCTFANMYGPTEITDICIYYIIDREFEDSDPLPIGVACPNMRVMLLDEHNNEVKSPNERGEICILGSGIGMGYWNNREITDGVFVQNPLNKNYHEMMYRTGDIGYYSEDGLIMFVGRRDSQFKFRGNRIELGDIEVAAASIDNINNACAMFWAEEQKIVLFLETAEQIKERKFNIELKKYVPSYMVPQKIICLEKFPHTPSGKIDRVGLRKTYLI